MKQSFQVNNSSFEFLEDDQALKIEDKIWWKAGRRFIIKRFLNRAVRETTISSILDIGCGSGAEFQLLSNFGAVSGVERSPKFLRRAKKRNIAVKIYEGDFFSIVPNEAFDLYCLIDMLEHNEDDDAVLKHINRQSEVGHLLLICVPAFQFLFSQHDRMLHHYRRYSRSDIKQLLHTNNYEMIISGYFFFFLFPFAVCSRLKEKVLYRCGLKQKRVNIGKVPPLINSLFILLLKLEAFMSRVIRFPFGLWFIALAKKHP